MGKKKNKEGKAPKVNKELSGFNIKVNSFGEIISDYDLDHINKFLNRNVDDKKLRDREDLDNLKKRSKEDKEKED